MLQVFRYSDSELETLLSDIESDLAERKETWQGDAPEKGRQAVCAFANDLPDHQRPGVLIVGARNDGTPSGLAITDSLLCTLADIKTDGQTLPPPTIVVEKRTLRGAEMAVVTVYPADAPPVRYRGRIWVRIGPRRGIATAQDERILNERRRFRDIPFDAQPMPSSTIHDLSRVLFEQEYLPNAFAIDVVAANERTYEQRLAACKMISSVETPLPTVLGHLVIGIATRDWIPGAYAQFLRINGTELSDPITDDSLIDGPLGQVIRRLDDKLDAHIQVAVDIVSNSIETKDAMHPRVALQQFTRNALMHRTYEGTHAPIRIYWFNDRIEIMNPGGPYGLVTKQNFGRPGYTDYRNPHLADALKVLGFVQRFGIGIQTAKAALEQNGNPPPEFAIEETNVLVTVRIKQ